MPRPALPLPTATVPPPFHWMAWQADPSLPGLACSSYEETASSPIHRLEPPCDKITLILCADAALHLQEIHPLSPTDTLHAFVVGLRSTPLRVRHDGAQQLIEVKLTPDTAYALFNIAPAELTTRPVSLSDLWGAEARTLLSQVQDLHTQQARLACVANALAQRMHDATRTWPAAIHWAWSQILRTHGQVRVCDLANTIGWSERHFAQRFLAHIGLRPKECLQLARFDTALQAIQQTPRCTLADIAAQHGYSDQSHITREFQRFASCPPARFETLHFPDRPGLDASRLYL